MEKIEMLPQIRAALMSRVRMLQELSEQAYAVEAQIKKIAESLLCFENITPSPETGKRDTKIIPFPVSGNKYSKNPGYVPRAGISEKHPYLVPVEAKPGEPLPDSIPDFRLSLQRDGLILLSWDKKRTEKGELYTAYWVTSTGTFRYFASVPMNKRDFVFAQPDHKSYAAEDGTEFYGETPPCYVVHVAPEFMMSLRGQVDTRPLHIEKLKALGVKSDFEYKFLLTQKKAKRLAKNAEPVIEKNMA